MPTLDDVKKSLEALENGGDLYGVVVSAIDQARTTERQKGIDENRNVRKERDGLARYKNAVNDLGYDGGELETFVSDLKGKIQTGPKRRQ